MKICVPHQLRHDIVAKVLDNFEKTMPIFADMVEVANEINQAVGQTEATRLGKIMHAAIRCASPDELKMVRRLFALLACQPVNYYDLREKVSVQSTAFRPTSQQEIELNGFRLFCSMLCIDCIDAPHRAFVQSIIDRRSVFPARLVQLIEIGENGGLPAEHGSEFVSLCVDLFIRPDTAIVSYQEHQRLQSINKVAAQVLITNSLAFNHLTPSVASVPAAHERMQQQRIKTIPVWQGPVGLDVILRQTSCLAPPVKIKFPNSAGGHDLHDYQETFVEFEERLQALTPAGRQYFESLFAAGKQNIRLPEFDPGYGQHYYDVMADALQEFPRDAKTLWQQGLAYFTFQIDPNASHGQDLPLDQLIEKDIVQLIPQQYEDFFGPAATNIFNSNIGLEGVSHVGVVSGDSKQQFESCLGAAVVNMYDYYEKIQADSRQAVLRRRPSQAS